MSLITPQFQSRLAALELALRRALPSSLRGDRRSPTRKGISLEFADYRNYVPGDDVRHLDWASYARLDQLIVKLYHDEEDVQMYILVDDSRSMAYGDGRKQRFAREVAAGLAWVGLAGANRVSVVLLRDEAHILPLGRGSGAMLPILEKLEEAPLPAAVPLHEACADFMARARPRGSIVLISDLLDRGGVGASLRELQRLMTEVSVIHLLAKEELDPALEGDLRLIDSETEQKVDVNLSPSIIAAYRARVRAFIAECAEVSRRRNAAYAQTVADDAFEDFMLGPLVQVGILR